jgi:hypothetical protein
MLPIPMLDPCKTVVVVRPLADSTSPSALLNNGGRARNQPVGHLNSRLLGGLEIDNKFKPLGLRVRYVARIGTAEYFDDLPACERET